MNASNNKETNQRLLNTTQLLVSDYCGFFFACEQIYPETVVEQVHFAESNIGTLLQLLDKRAAARPQQLKALSSYAAFCTVSSVSVCMSLCLGLASCLYLCVVNAC